MAVGARITSENLSGKTATVTFTPYTGETSGTTVNLGTKVIPFNNITAHPYGDYSLYFPEYDYTYTLTIPEPVTNTQMFVVTDRMVGSNNYGSAMLNFSDFTTEIIDLGVDSTYWNNDNVNPLQDSGFMYRFSGVSDFLEKLIIFTNASGVEIGRYSGTTDNYDSDSIDGRLVTFEDVDNGVLTYSNGTSVNTYTWNPQTHQIDIEWDWYGVTSDNTFIIKKYELGQWVYNGNGQSFLVNSNDGTTTLFKSWSDGTYVRHKMQPNTDFIVVETESQGNSNRYINFEICNTSGSVLETVSLTGNTYNSRSDDFLGTNKYCIMYHKYEDTSVDYKIVHYNGDTGTLTETSHVRGANYITYNMRGDDNFYPEQSLKNGGVVITFYDSQNYNVLGEMVNYCDIVYMLDNQTSFNTYQVANNTPVEIETYGQLSNIYRTRISTSPNNQFEILTISSTGGTITNTGISIAAISGVNNYYLDDRTIYQVYSGDALDVYCFLIGVNGSISSMLSKSLVNQYDSNVTTQGKVAYLTFATSAGNEAYYVYSGSTGFTSTSHYDQRFRADETYSDTFLEPEVIFLFQQDGVNNRGRILTSNGITSELDFPEFYNYIVSVGNDKIMIVYVDTNDNNYVKIKLYNLSGTLLNSTSTTYTGWDDSFAINNMFVVKFNGDGTDEYFLVSEETITSSTLSSYNDKWAPNDYFWWDNW